MSPRPQLAREEEPMDEQAAVDGTERVLLRFLPDGTEVRVPSGTPIFDAASWNGIAIDSTCGGHGTCRKCKVQVLRGHAPISPLDPRAFNTQELHDGWRLACRAPAREDLVVSVPPLQTRPKAALVGVGRHVILRPAVVKRYVELQEPTMEDQRSDVQRLLDAIDDLEPHIPLAVVRKLGGVLRASAFKVTAVIVDEEMIDVEPGDTTGSRHALAFDLGTTTVVATLLDLESGQPLAVQSLLNAQQPFGGDVISRISATMMDPDALDTLRSRAHETMAALAGEVCEEAGIAPEQVYEITVCGNATMMHLALGIDPEPLSMAPFTVTTHEPPETLAATSASACTRAHRPSSSPRWAPMWAATSWPACSPPASRATAASASSSTWAPTARSRWAARSACWPRRRRRAPPSRPPRSAAACAPPRAPSRASASPRTGSSCRSSPTPSPSACAARAWSTAWPSSCAPGCSTTPGASSPTRRPPSACPPSRRG
jgi:ferredoxin